MGMFAAIVRELSAAGLSVEQIGDAVDRIEDAAVLPAPIDEATERRRAKDRERKRLRNSADMPAEIPRNGVENGSSNKEKSPTPSKEINSSPTSLRSFSFSARELAIEFSKTFWPEYPNKVGRPKALKAFSAARKRADLDRIMFGLQRYIRERPPDRQWLNPATFLNQDRFDDQPASHPATNGKPTAHDALLRAVAEQFAPGHGPGSGPAGDDGGFHDEPGSAPGDRQPAFDLQPGDYRVHK